jgi:phenylpropionate dioxygenase-like ring-hydroxylating dioxygenase large terminal subunit
MSESVFNNKSKVPVGWYVIARSTEVRSGEVKEKLLLGKKFALFRTEKGEIKLVLAKCPHMGASLAYGVVKGENLVCPFHQLHVDGAGKCQSFPADEAVKDKFSVTAFRVEERWGQVWFYAGESPLYSLDSFAKDVAGMDYMLFSRASYNPHFHVMVPNALDYVHFDLVHGLVAKTFDFSKGAQSLRAHIDFEITRRAPALFHLLGLKKMELIFETYGGNNYLVQILQPFRMSFLTSYAQANEGGTLSSTAAFFPKGNILGKITGVELILRYLRMSLINAFFADDVKVIRHIDFTPKFTTHDRYYVEYVKYINELPAWRDF